MKDNTRERAIDILKGHKYTLLTKQTNNDIGWKNINCEVWHCGKDGSSSYAFDIAIMPMGISVYGDIGELTFNVYGRGMDFLAGKDVDYYIHSKLSHNCKEKEFSKRKFYSVVMEYILSNMEDKEIDDEDFEKLTEYSNNDDFESFKDFTENLYLNTDVKENIHGYYYELNEFLNKVYDQHDDRSAHELLYNTDFLEFDDVWEYSFTEMDRGLWFRLNMINIAAQKIMEIKENMKEG